MFLKANYICNNFWGKKYIIKKKKEKEKKKKQNKKKNKILFFKLVTFDRRVAKNEDNLFYYMGYLEWCVKIRMLYHF